MLNDIASYYLKNDGRIWVQTMSKFHRPATDTERAEIEKCVGRKHRHPRPRLHLAYAAHAA